MQRDFPRESVGALRGLLGAFQFSGDDVEKKVRALSGGEKSRLVMARMLLEPPNFLVLDEPTNHLDLATKEMLVEALRDFEGTMLFVSHDRAFLRGLANRVLELGGETGTEPEPHLYPGLLRRVRGADRPRGPRRARMTRLLAGAALVLAQVSSPEFPSQVELVTVDVIVVDAKGQPVLDLTRDDFVVKEDGAAQEIVSFERFGSADDVLVEAPSPGSTAGPAARAPHAGAVVAVIVDDQGLSLRESKDTRDAIARFVNVALRDGDAITLTTTSGNAWWTTTMPEGRPDVLAVAGRLQGKATDAAVAFDYMSDYEAFAIRERDDASVVGRVVQRWTATGACMIVQGRQDPGCPSRVRATASAMDGDRRNRTQSLLATLRRTLDALAVRPGRKSILLFSRGFLQDSDTTARDVAAAARTANAAVYFVDARGLQGLALPVQRGQSPGRPTRRTSAGRASRPASWSRAEPRRWPTRREAPPSGTPTTSGGRRRASPASRARTTSSGSIPGPTRRPPPGAS